jgi:hypothetical protein
LLALSPSEELPLDSTQIHLPESQIESISVAPGALRIDFSRVYLLKSMTGSKERTRWWQAGSLTLEGVEELPSPRVGPLTCAGGDIDDNVYTYRDMVPVPFASRGHIRFRLRFEGAAEPLDVVGTSARLDLLDVAKYIEHIRS